MEVFLEFLKGPMFRVTFLIMVLGLLRHLFLLLFGMIQAVHKAADPVPPYSAPFSKLTKVTLGWLFPLKHIKSRKLYSLFSILFHIGVIIVPLFLLAHIQLWKAGLGFGWPAISNNIADILTLITISCGILLFFGRILDKDSRFISRPQDFLMTWLLVIPFISGYLAMNPHLLPVSYTLMMIVHVLSAELIFVLIPFTKITHCVLYPLAHYASNYAWRFIPQAGEKVTKSLGKEVRV